jgi:hypothetical protein
MKYTAIIIEPRKHAAIEFVLKNALECLSEDWSIVFFHGNHNGDYVRNIVKDLNRIQLVHLPVDNLTLMQYSELLSTKSIIYDYVTEVFLIFQTDSMIFPENKHLINDFLEYDYVGAPWMICNHYATMICSYVGNGGFSLRRKSKMLEIIDTVKWVSMNEDLYFATNYDTISVYKPSYDMAKTFSVEAVYSDITFACHKPWVEMHYPDFKLIYPEVEILRQLQYIIQ